MGAMNFRNAHKSAPENSDDQNAGDVLGLLQAAMQRSQMQPGAYYGWSPNSANGYAGPQGGLLGRLIALQAEQSPYQSAAGSGQTLAAPQDPNFRQLVRVNAPGRVAVDPSNRSDGQLRPSYASFDSGGDGSVGTGSRDPTLIPQARGDSSGVYEDKSVPSSGVNALTKTAQIPLPGRLPLLPGPTPEQPPIKIPMPTIPDWLKKDWQLLQLFPSVLSRIISGDSNSEEGKKNNLCYQRWEKEYANCDMFQKRGNNRWRDACRVRAGDRRNLCYANGGTPDPDEPDEYWWNDIPPNPAGR